MVKSNNTSPGTTAEQNSLTSLSTNFCFVQALATQQDITRQLVDAGILKQNDVAAVATSE